MYDFKEHSILYNQILLLTDAEQQEPVKSIQHFFEDYHLHEIRQHLWNLFEIAVTTENDLYQEGSERNKLLAFHRKLERLVEAAYLLQIREKH